MIPIRVAPPITTKPFNRGVFNQLMLFIIIPPVTLVQIAVTSVNTPLSPAIPEHSMINRQPTI